MLNAGDMNIGCSTPAIRQLRQRFQATGRTEDRPRSGRPRVTTRGQDCYIRNTHLLNRFQTATATAANTDGTHNNHISAQTVRYCLLKCGLSARRPYVVCVLARRHRVSLINWERTRQRWLRQQWNSVLLSDKSRITIHRGDDRVRVYRRRIERYAYLNKIVLGVRVLSWSGRALHSSRRYRRDYECPTIP